MTSGDYQSVLEEHFNARKQRNPAYSLRSFARDLGWSPARLSQAMNGRAGLSTAKAVVIAEKLSLSQNEKELFVATVAKKYDRSQSVKQTAAKRVKQLREQNELNKFSEESFKVIRDWYHLAIVELLKTRGFQSSAEWIANRLDLSVQTVSKAIARLKEVGLLTEDSGELLATHNKNAIGNGVSSEAIRSFHGQILNKAIDSIYSQPVSERNLSASIVAIDKENLPAMTAKIQEFRRELCREFGANDKSLKNSLYCVSIQCFSLEKGAFHGRDE